MASKGQGGMAENRLALLRRDGLSAAKEVLYELDKYLSNRLHSFAVPTVDVAMHDLIEEFIFQEPPGSPTTGKKFSSLQELQLLEIIGSYFHEQSKDALRQLVFSSLFKPRGNMADPARLSLLSRLLSMAVAVARAPVLDCTAVWMQRTPVPFCTELVQSLVEDYCSLVPDVITTLQQAVTTSPRFCCQLITAITTLYDLSSGAFTPPPNLLNVVVTWVCEKPQLTLHNFLNSPIPASSPQGFLDLTPLAGLITWCVLSPLVTRVGSKVDTDAHGSSTVIMNDQKSEKLKQEGEGAEDDQTLVYSRLHLGVLQVLQLLYSHMAEKKLLGRLALISLDQVSTLVSELKRQGQEFNPLCPTPRLQLSLERFAQAMQLSMAMGALLCSRDDLRKVCSGLPPSSLLQLVLKGPAQPAPEPFPYYPHIQTTPPSYSAAQSSSNYASFRNLQ